MEQQGTLKAKLCSPEVEMEDFSPRDEEFHRNKAHFDEHNDECQIFPMISDVTPNAKYKLICVCFLSLTFMLIEALGGYISGSIAIMSDAAHLLSDIFGFICSIIALHLAGKRANFKMSYGYHRAEIMGALMSIVTIWILTVMLVAFAAYRLIHPEKLTGWEMLIIGTCGMIVNVSIGAVLHWPNSNDQEKEKNKNEPVEMTASKPPVSTLTESNRRPMKSKNLSEVEDHDNANVRAALIHILGDLVQSMGIVLVAAVVTAAQYYNWRNVDFLDPCCTFMFAVIVACTSIPMFMEFLHIIMEGTPEALDMDDFISFLTEIPEVEEVHDVHVWSMTVGKPAMTCHLVSKEPIKALRKATRVCRRHGIYHSTIQVECTKEKTSGLYVNCEHNLH